MKATITTCALLLAGFFLGCLFATGKFEKPAAAQAPLQGQAANAPRYQISAWGMGHPNLPPGNGIGAWGCYIIDTVTGDMWHVTADGPAKKLSTRLK